MSTRNLLMICLALITGGVFVAPGVVYAGIDSGVATGLSSIMLLAGIIAAVLTVDTDTKVASRKGESKK
jgi:hypothetical protein